MAKRERQASNSSSDHIDGIMTPSTSSNSEGISRPSKIASMEPEEKSTDAAHMYCNLPPHKTMRFTSYDEYENHYQQSHTNRCRACRKNFPSSRFLELHIAENHDPLLATRRDAGEKTFACFVENCDKVCSGWQKRRSHLIDKHGFPRNYDFLIVNNGIDGRRSMLRPGIDAQGHRKSSRERRGSDATEASESPKALSVSPSLNRNAVTQTQAMEGVASKTANNAESENVDSLTKSLSALRMVPRSITFGQRKGKVGFAKS